MLEQASRLIHAAGYADGLYPAQWVALTYFAEAPPSTRTAASLARFQGLSLAPVARTVRTLVDKGLLERCANPRSRRADLIEVTDQGRSLLARAPAVVLTTILADVPPTQRAVLAEALELVLCRLFQTAGAAADPDARPATDPVPTPPTAA